MKFMLNVKETLKHTKYFLILIGLLAIITISKIILVTVLVGLVVWCLLKLKVLKEKGE